jgi:hypothetical protein
MPKNDGSLDSERLIIKLKAPIAISIKEVIRFGTAE